MTIILGAAFLGNQVYEWLFSPTRWYTNSYGSLFFIMTGLHGLHVFIGLRRHDLPPGPHARRPGATPASSPPSRA